MTKGPIGRLTVTVCVLLALDTATPANADSVRDRQWHLLTLHVAAAQQLSAGTNVTVAVVDTGVDGRHVDLAGNVLPGPDFTSPDGDGRTDDDGHGTAMASLIAGHGHGAGGGVLGIAPGAKILPVRTRVTFSRGDIAEGVQWSVDHNADVINLSLVTGESPALGEAINEALANDVVVVAGVGLPGGLGKVPAPARIPGVVAVSGVDKAGNIVVSMSGPEVTIAAPAKDIAHAAKGGGYGLGTGTSDATAIVSGVVALIRSKYPDLDAANVINRLIQTADDKGPPGRDEQYGFGIVNPVRALTADVPRVDSNPLLGSVTQTTSPVAPEPSQAKPSAAPSDSDPPWIWLGISLAVVLVAGATTVLVLKRAGAGS
jgi:type VII secretion-associated serine protease mycosin